MKYIINCIHWEIIDHHQYHISYIHINHRRGFLFAQWCLCCEFSLAIELVQSPEFPVSSDAHGNGQGSFVHKLLNNQVERRQRSLGD